MFEKVREYFGSKTSPDTTLSRSQLSADLKLATAVVLVGAATAEGGLSTDEHGSILAAIEKHLGIQRAHAEALIGEAQRNGPSKLESFLGSIKSHFSRDQLERVLALAWSVIISDGQISKQEGIFAAKLRVLLGLSLEEAVRARKLAEDYGIDGFKEIVEASEAVTSVKR